jgi:hypothetical protein
MAKIGPYFGKHKATCGSGGISASTPKDLPVYPYPLFMSYAALPADQAYSITKAMIDGYDIYKAGAPGAAGLSVKAQNLKWAVPFHPGAVKALKEAGVWGAAEDAHNADLMKRQQTLAAAWNDFLKASPPSEKTAFAKAWMTARKAALSKAGMDAIFE